MDSQSKKKPPILILEDSRADRARFRLLFPGKETQYEFAWAWKQKDGCSVLHWLERESGKASDVIADTNTGEDEEAAPGQVLRNLLDEHEQLRQSLISFKLLFLDLAWTNQAESVMHKLQHLSMRQGNDLALDSPATNSELRNLINKVEGIALLEWLKDNGWGREQHPHRPAVWVTSAYVPMTAVGMREFLKVRYGLQGGLHLFHKWMDDAPLVSDLISFLTGLEKEKQR